MEVSIIHQIPIELRRLMHGFVPYKKCIMCKTVMVEFSSSPEVYVCSVPCLAEFNSTVLKRMGHSRAVIVGHKAALYMQFWLTISYITFTVCVSFVCPFLIFFFVAFRIVRVLFVSIYTFFITI